MPIQFAKQLPYTLHTNRELGLMLRGIKPLAVFSDGKDCFPAVMLRYLRLFDRHVAAGRFVRRDHLTKPTPQRGFALHTMLYALPAEVWRIDEMLRLRASELKGREFERREGELLGYEDWMNDHYLDRVYPREK